MDDGWMDNGWMNGPASWYTSPWEQSTFSRHTSVYFLLLLESFWAYMLYNMFVQLVLHLRYFLMFTKCF